MESVALVACFVESHEPALCPRYLTQAVSFTRDSLTESPFLHTIQGVNMVFWGGFVLFVFFPKIFVSFYMKSFIFEAGPFLCDWVTVG